MFSTRGQFYTSRQWEQFRRMLMLERLNGQGDIICELCDKPITSAYDCIAHHVKPLTDNNLNDYDISLNPANIQLVHHACHNEIHKRFGASYQRHIYIVYGSPCAGKSVYVDSVALPDDLIIDIDRIYNAINNVRSGRLISNAIAIRDSLVDMVRVRQGQWVNAYLVGNNFAGCYMWSDKDRRRLSSLLDAELVHIDTAQDICIARATAKGNGYEKFVSDWFKKYQAPPSC